MIISLNTTLAIENFINNFCFITLFLTMLFYWTQVGFGQFDFQKNYFNFGFISMACTNLLLLFSLILRWKSSQHFPLSNQNYRKLF